MQTTDFENLYTQHYIGILGYFMKNFNRDRTLAEDLAQDTFAKVFRYSLSHFNFICSKQYLYKVAENVKYDHIRRGKGLPIIDIDSIALPLLSDITESNSISDYSHFLHPSELALFELLSEGYNSYELSKIFNVTPSAVRARIAKLKKTIRQNRVKFLD